MWEEFRVSVSEETLGREVRSMGYRKLSARQRHHAQDAEAAEAFKNFPTTVAEIAAGPAKGKMIKIWFQDEARIGQKNKITRRWAKRGSRPSASHDQRTRSAYIFGAICPQHGNAAAPVMGCCDNHTMNRHLIEISRNVDDKAYAILIMDQSNPVARAVTMSSEYRYRNPKTIREATPHCRVSVLRPPIDLFRMRQTRSPPIHTFVSPKSTCI
ncbi:winged helix-turn-helix domain-containing protein [Rhizobium sp. Leaf386]|uniref:winged helix-turn-helix domain-containing protein n=1 Tax=Rhizobium sp. Leaf386 TaxID=1736359 RepID=UPI00244E9837|nr:winged helix-turn-helix domain-containing protein [Rhizobium sp. Leaf386]